MVADKQRWWLRLRNQTGFVNNPGSWASNSKRWVITEYKRARNGTENSGASAKLASRLGEDTLRARLDM